MHESATMELLTSKLCAVKDRSKIKEIVIGELEVHEPEHFKRELRAILKKNFPEVKAEISIKGPEMFCRCGYRTEDPNREVCPRCGAEMNCDLHKGVHLVVNG